jgi:hypothetical protein
MLLKSQLKFGDQDGENPPPFKKVKRRIPGLFVCAINTADSPKTLELKAKNRPLGAHVGDSLLLPPFVIWVSWPLVKSLIII